MDVLHKVESSNSKFICWWISQAFLRQMLTLVEPFCFTAKDTSLMNSPQRHFQNMHPNLIAQKHNIVGRKDRHWIVFVAWLCPQCSETLDKSGLSFSHRSRLFVWNGYKDVYHQDCESWMKFRYSHMLHNNTGSVMDYTQCWSPQIIIDLKSSYHLVMS